MRRPLFSTGHLVLEHSPTWCNVVKFDSCLREMKSKKTTGRKMKTQSTTAIRASISFSPDIYKTLETIAKKKKVSLAWVVREATERYVGEQWPLFAGLKHND
jgi:hypothetical protein